MIQASYSRCDGDYYSSEVNLVGQNSPDDANYTVEQNGLDGINALVATSPNEMQNQLQRSASPSPSESSPHLLLANLQLSPLPIAAAEEFKMKIIYDSDDSDNDDEATLNECKQAGWSSED